VLFPIPRRLIAHTVGATFGEASQLGLLMLFICDKRSPGEVCAAVEDACGRERIRVVRWRDVPVDPSALGDHARDTRPRILQAVLRAPSADDAARSEQRAHRARRRIDAFARAADRDVYVASCSFATVTTGARRRPARRVLSTSSTPTSGHRSSCSTSGTPNTADVGARSHTGCCVTTARSAIAGNANRMHAREGQAGTRDPRGGALPPAIDDADQARASSMRPSVTPKEGGMRGVGRDIRRVAIVVPAADGRTRPTWTKNGAGSTVGMRP
jgi:hypothetical protein